MKKIVAAMNRMHACTAMVLAGTLLFGWGILLSSIVLAEETSCKVFDPELQGTYRGGCKDGLAEGRGEARGKAASYSGGFRAGRKNGKGVKIWSSGDRYEGEFVEDRKEGKGVYVWGPGSQWAGERYRGDYRADKRRGHGVYEWPSGDRYSGMWENDRPMGPPTPGMLARARAYAELVAAVKPGRQVCRQMPVGIATRDLVRGTVIALDGEMIVVRVDAVGPYDHTLNDVPVKVGGTVRDWLIKWMPCQ